MADLRLRYGRLDHPSAGCGDRISPRGEPSPQATTQSQTAPTDRRQFLRAHWSVLAAADFFTVEVWGPRGLVTFYTQIGRNLTDPVDGFLTDKKLLIIDRDSKYSAAFRSLLARAGVEPVRLPPRSPNLNAYAERFVRSIKDECLSRMILFGEESLRRATREYAAHYHRERNHQGLGNRLIESGHAETAIGRVTCRERLGGMLRFYYGNAA